VTDFGTVRKDGSFGAVRFERVYGATPEQLWAAWTVPERLTRWLGASVSGPIEPGAAVTLVWGDDPDSQVALEIVELAPPERLEWRWTVAGEPPTVLRVELTAVPEGTRLVLDHARLPMSMFAGLAAGWHAYLDALAAGDAAGWDARWAELLPAYKGRAAEL
jgi:uncharacterized protein YndB with AHSA1/START domain